MLPQNVPLMPPWRASISVLHVLAISSTIFRLSQRYTSQRLWYDDYIALFAVIVDCVYFVALHVWTRSEPNGTTFGKETTITFYWIGTVCFFLVLWSAKTSLALAIARIFPPGRTIRRFAIGMAWSFGFLCIAILLGMSISCGRDTSWHDSPEVQCDLPKALTIVGFFAAVISDALLVFTPFRVLWRMKLPDEQRRLILAGFAASVWTSITGVIPFVFSLEPGPSQRIILPLLGHAMATISLMVCNSMVIVTYVYRLVRSDKDLERSISGAASNGDMSPLTTIVLTELGSLDSFGQNSYRRGTSCNGSSFSERNLGLFSPSSLSITPQTIPQMSRSTMKAGFSSVQF